MENQYWITYKEVPEKVELVYPLPIKCMRCGQGYEKYPIHIEHIMNINESVLSKINSVDWIAHLGPNDDTRSYYLGDIKITTSHDSGRGYIIYPDNRVELACPYEIDNLRSIDDLGKVRKYASGFRKGNRVFVDTIYFKN